MQAAQQAQRGAEVGGVARLRDLHGRAVDPAARELRGFEVEDARDAFDAGAEREA